MERPELPPEWEAQDAEGPEPEPQMKAYTVTMYEADHDAMVEIAKLYDRSFAAEMRAAARLHMLRHGKVSVSAEEKPRAHNKPRLM